jgi:hypothetical protein
MTNENAKAKKTTEREFYGILKDYATEKKNQEAVDFCLKKIKQLDDKKANAKKKSSADEATIERCTEIVLDTMEEGTGYTATMIANFEGIAPISSQYITRNVLTPLVEEGTLTRATEKGSSIYRLAVDEVEGEE